MVSSLTPCNTPPRLSNTCKVPAAPPVSQQPPPTVVRDFLTIATTFGNRIFGVDHAKPVTSAPQHAHQKPHQPPQTPTLPLLHLPPLPSSPLTSSPHSMASPSSLVLLEHPDAAAVTVPITPLVPTLSLSNLDDLHTPRASPCNTPVPCRSRRTSPPRHDPLPCLKSPHGLLRSRIPAYATQRERMDVLLLHECPKWSDLTHAAWNGCSPTSRAQVWRMLVSYEPLPHTKRATALHQKRAQYRHFVRALYAPLGRVHFDCSSPVCTAEVDDLDVYNVDRDGYIDDTDFFAHLNMQPQGDENHNGNGNKKEHDANLCHQHDDGDDHSPDSPLSLKRQVIEYSTFSAKTLRQIEMDLPRTHPKLPVFHVPQVRNAMRRVLYIFGMLNPNNNYVQGMNEIVTPIILVFLTEHLRHAESRNMMRMLHRTELDGILTEQQLADAEADAFWTFSAIVRSVEDNFVADQPGILRRVARLEEIVWHVDAALAAHLAHNGNEFLQFSFRWMNCLLMRELPFHLVVMLWDALLAEEDGVADLHVYFCAALLTRFSEELQVMDFEECILLLQRLPTQCWRYEDINELLSQAKIWKQSLKLESLAL